MKLQQFYITSALGALALVLAITSIMMGRNNQSLNTLLQQKQAQIQQVQAMVQTGQNLVRRMAEVSLTNDKIKDVLAKSGIQVNQSAPGSEAAPAPSVPAPAAPAPATPAPTPVPTPVE